MSRPEPTIDRAPRVSDEVRKTTCYMCACRCGINVHLKEGRVTYIEGNRDHPVNKGVLCAKGSAGIKQVLSPARLKAPLKRVGPRGSGAFEEITWDEALERAAAGETEAETALVRLRAPGVDQAIADAADGEEPAAGDPRARQRRARRRSRGDDRRRRAPRLGDRAGVRPRARRRGASRSPRGDGSRRS